MSDIWTRKRYPRFKRGEVIAMTKEAIGANLKGRGSIYGIAAPSRKGRLTVRVRRVNQRTWSDFYVGFWRHTTVTEKLASRRVRGDRTDG